MCEENFMDNFLMLTEQEKENKKKCYILHTVHQFFKDFEYPLACVWDPETKTAKVI